MQMRQGRQWSVGRRWNPSRTARLPSHDVVWVDAGLQKSPEMQEVRPLTVPELERWPTVQEESVTEAIHLPSESAGAGE